MREIVLDTETTGIDPQQGHRIVEIGAIELFNHMPTGSFFHSHLDPQRDMPKEAEAVHGLSAQFLKGKPLFADVADKFLAFIEGAQLVIHNAAFDVGFLNAELSHIQKPQIEWERVTDTLALARRKYPMASNSLDALCRRFGVDLSRRTKHGALVDCELLADVYLELVGGRQISLSLRDEKSRSGVKLSPSSHTVPGRAGVLGARLTDDEMAAHAALIESLGGRSLWRAD
jgi:DNA polymerase III subunit epsilon